jgi:chaperonin GroES
MKLKAYGKRILIEVSAPETVTESGIIIPGKKDEPSNKGIVVSVGDDIKDIKATDLIYFNKFTGAEIEYNKFKYLSIKGEDVHAVVSK